MSCRRMNQHSLQKRDFRCEECGAINGFIVHSEEALTENVSQAIFFHSNNFGKSKNRSRRFWRETVMLELPKEDYTTEVRNGKTYHICTLRQMVLHTIGLDYRRPYTRNGRKFYKPYRNYFTTGKKSGLFRPLVEAGYMTESSMHHTPDDTEHYNYSLTRAGLDWLGEQIGVKIHDEE